MIRKLSFPLSIVLVLLISGCGLRLDTGSPAESETPLTQSIRSSAIEGVAEIREQAQELGLRVRNNELPLDEQIDPQQLDDFLTGIAQRADSQLELLGPATEISPEPNSQNEAAQPDEGRSSEPISLRKFQGSLESLSKLLLDGVVEAEPEMARLIGSIAASSLIWSRDLEEITLSNAESAEVEENELAPQELPEISHPNQEWITLVTSWDRVAYLLEISAARSADNRESLAAEAREYRQRAHDWARALGVEGGDGDPRLVSYATPQLTGEFEQDVDALAEAVREEISAANYVLGDLLYVIDPEQRPAAVWQLVNIQDDNRRWGIESAELIGLRETAAVLSVD